MSHTDAHVPEWVAATRALPWQVDVRHHYRCRQRLNPFGRPAMWLDCDLGTGPGARCNLLVSSQYSTQPYMRRGSAFESSRARVRDELRAAVTEYNTFGSTDADPVAYDHAWCLCQMCGHGIW